VCYIGPDSETFSIRLLLDAGAIQSHPALKKLDRQGIPWFTPSGKLHRLALYVANHDWEAATAICKMYADISTPFGVITFPRSVVESPVADGKDGPDQWTYLAGLH